MHKPKIYIVDAVCVFLICLIVAGVCHITNHWKFGLSPDSCAYVSCGINMAQGKGLTSNHWNLKTGEIEQFIRLQQPPLYSASIAFLSILGFPPVTAAFFITFTSMLLSPVVVYFIGRILSGNLCGFICGLLCATTVAYINKGFWAWTEAPYTLLILLAILFYVLSDQSTIIKKEIWFVVGCSLLLILSFHYRYIGLFAIVPFGVAMLRKAIEDKANIKPLLIFCIVTIVGIVPIMIINHAYTGSIGGAKRAAETNIFWPTLSSGISSLITVFFGGLIKWQESLQRGNLQAKIALVYFFGLIAIYIWMVIKNKKSHVILGYVLITFASLVIMRSKTYFDGLDSHGSRLLSPLFPVMTLLAGLVFYKLISVYIKNKNRFVAGSLIFSFIAMHLVFQSGYAYGRATDYAIIGMQKAPETLEWLENNIPQDSKILINYQAKQITPYTKKYHTRNISYSKGSYWKQENFIKHIQSNKSTTWMVFMWHPYKDSRYEITRYGPYVQNLLSKGQNQEFKLAAKLSDGLVFKSIEK